MPSISNWDKEIHSSLSITSWNVERIKSLSKEESNRLTILNNNLRFSILNSIYEQSFLFKFNKWKKVYDYLKKNGKVRSKLQRLDLFLYWLKNRNN